MSAKKRIAVVVRSLQLGGMERAAINLAETFAAAGHEVHLIYFRDRNRALTPNDDVSVHLFDMEKRMKRSPTGILAYLGARLYNLVFRKGYFFPLGLYLAPKFEKRIAELEKRLGGKFDLIILRGQATFEMVWASKDPRLVIQQVNISILRNVPLQHFYHRLLFGDKRIVSNARSVHENLMQVNDICGARPRSMHVIPSPVNVDVVRARAEAYRPDIDRPYIVNIGRIVPVKNISLLVEAYAYARKHLGLEHALVIVGDGSERPAVERQIASAGLEEHVRLTGALQNPYPWLKHADLFAFTSKHEGLPNVLLESLACRTPIVATRGEGGTVDIMQGELANNLVGFDAKEVAEKMVTVLQQEHPDFDTLLQPYLPRAVADAYIETFITDQPVAL